MQNVLRRRSDLTLLNVPDSFIILLDVLVKEDAKF
jgi:hypothetical protein